MPKQNKIHGKIMTDKNPVGSAVFLFPGGMGHQCQNIYGSEQPMDKFKVGDELAMGEKKVIITSIDLVPKENRPSGELDYYRVNLAEVA